MTTTRTLLIAILAGLVAALLTRGVLRRGGMPRPMSAGGGHVAVVPDLPPLPATAPAALPAESLAVEPPRPATQPAEAPPVVREDRPILPAAPRKADARGPKPEFKLEAGQPIPEPIARVALAFVGTDADAEKVWTAAINDPNTPAKVRKNLIEDLNEDGFPDPKHITPDDLPLIASRIKLIEEMAPDALDEDNAAAFAEAYKDLINMYAKASQQ